MNLCYRRVPKKEELAHCIENMVDLAQVFNCYLMYSIQDSFAWNMTVGSKAEREVDNTFLAGLSKELIPSF